MVQKGSVSLFLYWKHWAQRINFVKLDNLHSGEQSERNKNDWIICSPSPILFYIHGPQSLLADSRDDNDHYVGQRLVAAVLLWNPHSLRSHLHFYWQLFSRQKGLRRQFVNPAQPSRSVEQEEKESNKVN